MPGMGAWAGLPSLHGAVTTTTGRSIYPVTVQEHCITRCAPANEKQDKKQEMGMSYSIPHCVLRQAFHVDPYRAKKNGFSLRDLAIFVDLLAYLYDHERAGMRGTMNVRGLYLFCHESPLGNARSSDLFDRLEITCDDYKTARSWKDYSMKFDDTNMPRGVTVLTLDDLGGGEEAILTTLKGLRAA
jgi:CRISPR-associated protein Csd2